MHDNRWARNDSGGAKSSGASLDVSAVQEWFKAAGLDPGSAVYALEIKSLASSFEELRIPPRMPGRFVRLSARRCRQQFTTAKVGASPDSGQLQLQPIGSSSSYNTYFPEPVRFMFVLVPMMGLYGGGLWWWRRRWSRLTGASTALIFPADSSAGKFASDGPGREHEARHIVCFRCFSAMCRISPRTQLTTTTARPCWNWFNGIVNACYPRWKHTTAGS